MPWIIGCCCLASLCRLGCTDGEIFTNKDCSGSPAAPSDRLQTQIYYFKPLSMNSKDWLPLYFKDAELRVSSTDDEVKHPTFHTLEWLCARDGMHCQLCGVVDPQVCHIIPTCRGAALFHEYISQRDRESIMSRLPRYTLSHDVNAKGIHGFTNLVQLCYNHRVAWHQHDLGLMPFPNVAFDANRQPLPYHGVEDPLGSCASLEYPKQRPYAANLNESPRSFSPKVWHVSLDYDQLYKTGSVRLPGPRSYEGYWPPEFLWTYRFASTVACKFGNDDLVAWLSTWTEKFRIYDDHSSTASTAPTSDHPPSHCGRKRAREEEEYDDGAPPRKRRDGIANQGTPVRGYSVNIVNANLPEDKFNAINIWRKKVIT